MQPTKAVPAHMELIEKGVEGLLIDEVKTKELLSEVLGDFYSKPKKGCDNQKKGVLTARLVVTMAIKAIESLKEGKLGLLDPLVSECQCQLRALKIAYLANRLLNSSAFRNELDQTLGALRKQQTALHKLGQSMNKVVFMDMSERSIKMIVGEKILVSDEVITLTQCYMLALAKSIKKREEECSHCKAVISSFSEVTEVSKLSKLQKGAFKSQNKAIVYLAKEKLAKSSCEDLQKMMAQVPGEAEVLEKLKREVGKESKKVELPSYYSLRAALKVAIAEEIPLLLKVKRAAHHLERQEEPFELASLYLPSDKKEYKPAPLSIDVSKKAAIVIEAQRVGKDPKEPIEDYLARLESIPFMEVIEMNGAVHRMYTDGDEPLMALIDSAEKDRLQDLKEKAIKIGCTRDNQQLLYINHIFADIISNQTKGLYIKE